MKTAVVGMQNTLLSEAVALALQKNGTFRTERVLPDKPDDDTIFLCKALEADVLLMEVVSRAGYTLKERLSLTRSLRQNVPECKVALLCDEYSSPSLADAVKEARQARKIDAFFYTSVTASYLASALDAL